MTTAAPAQTNTTPAVTRRKRHPLRWLLGISLVIVLLVAIGVGNFVYTWSNPYPPQAVAQAAMQSNATVTVTDKADQVIFMPSTAPTVGFVFYPGARVAPAAYAPIMHAIADSGYAVFVIKLPLNFALLGTNRAADIIAANPTIKVWAVGGHSLGGVAAAFYADSKPAAVKGLVFFASYPNNDMSSRTDLSVVSISASKDGLATPDKIEASKKLLPASAKFVVIAGGDHAQFGDYGPQDGDNAATTSQADQIKQTSAATVALLAQIGASGS